ncbi:olfactory receptor 5B2-like [Polypterus senegalus]|uniref:olfactory receptor 5B2-like n=1 Tax=Polypterus senegalus TaxID=55291 RepID=UPI0019623FB5|nr:olfactory receptor 5B2-like [Polypterus senegalus]
MNYQVTSTTATVNSSAFVRPQGFYIRGFNLAQYTTYYYTILSLLYILTLLANIMLLSIILWVECLHTPKYIAIFALSITDIGCSTAIIPKCVDAFLMKSKFIVYESCLTQMFFVHYFSATESFTLAILAYDRLIAICFPLRSNTINTNARMVLIILVSWSTAFMLVAVGVSFIPHLSFCKSTIINSHFCDYGPVYNLACNNIYASFVTSGFFVIAIIFLPLSFIVASYICIICTVAKIVSAEAQWKAFKTCTAHLMLVAIFYLPLLVTYVLVWATLYIDTDIRILNMTLSATLPPLLNPVIYSLKTEEIMAQMKKILKKKIIHSLL